MIERSQDVRHIIGLHAFYNGHIIELLVSCMRHHEMLTSTGFHIFMSVCAWDKNCSRVNTYISNCLNKSYSLAPIYSQALTDLQTMFFGMIFVITLKSFNFHIFVKRSINISTTFHIKLEICHVISTHQCLMKTSLHRTFKCWLNIIP